MTFASLIEPATLRAYRETHYRVHVEPPVTLRIGRPCPALAHLHRRHRASCSAFVTACNPFGRPLDEAANGSRMVALARELAERSLDSLEAIGEHPSNGWPAEPSLLVLGLEREATRALGERLDQNAVLWIGDEAVPELILLR